MLEAVKDDLESIFTLVDGSMKKGDQAVFEYLPGKGLRIEIAGVEKSVVPASKELFNLFLRVWIGETPPCKSFKEKVLGVAPAA